MRILFMNIFIGYIAAFGGFLCAVIFTSLAGNLGKRFRGCLMGFSGGLLISFVCFELLGHAFAYQNVYIIAFGIMAGVVISALTDGRIEAYKQKIKNAGANGAGKGSGYSKTFILLVIGIALHNIPEGMGLGTILAIAPETGYKMAVIIAVHCIPEGITVAIPLVENGLKLKKIVLLAAILAVPMAAGSGLMAVIHFASPFMATIILSLAGGVMIYITCGEILPESKGLWKGRLSTIAACVGFIAGIIMTAKL